VRVATFNLLHGRNPADGRVDPDRVADAVAATDADVLGLQEVDRCQPRSGRLDLARLAAGALSAPWWRFTPTILGTPGESWQPWPADPPADPPADVPAYGIALVSRLPVRRWQVTRLPAVPVRSPVWVPGPGGGPVLLRDEPRVLLAAVLDGPAGPLTVATTHLSFVPGCNAWQLRTVLAALRRLPAPRLLLGDLNLPGAVLPVLTRWRRLGRRPTYPAARPRLQLDHILADRDAAARLGPVRAAETPAAAVSDHRPLIVHLGVRDDR
jgi:endonuclease/exonuclease/phosphatase family metal-dependent hydrolase